MTRDRKVSMTYQEFEKLFNKKREKKSIIDVCIEWGLHRNTINYLREKAKVNPNGVISEELAEKIK